MSEYSRYNVVEDEFVTQTELVKRMGISLTKLKCIRRNPANNFPTPLNFDGPNRYSVKEVNAWLTKRKQGNQGSLSVDELSNQLQQTLGKRKSQTTGDNE